MPIILSKPINRISQSAFGEIAYEVMKRIFEIHNEFGRFFDEKIYKRMLAIRLPDVNLEVPIEIVFETFRKEYFLDVLFSDCGVFELKAVEKLTSRHRAQLLNYLLLLDLAHGKLVNVRPATIEHEFVNTQWRFSDRLEFKIDRERWNADFANATQVEEFSIAFLKDVGTGLEISLYEEAIFHLLRANQPTEMDVWSTLGSESLGQQKFHLLSEGVAIKITGLERSLDGFETHARRLLNHVDLRAIAWININLKQVTFASLCK